MADQRPPNPNRYIIENDQDGNSFVSPSLPASLDVKSNLGGSFQRLAYQTEPGPVSLTGNRDLKRYETALQAQIPTISPGGGANVWYNDIPPGVESPMHRNVSLDIIIVLLGEVELTLSNNVTRIVKPGDMVIQRCTLHKWRNPSETKWARMVAIASGCQPYITDNGEVLGTYFPNA